MTNAQIRERLIAGLVDTIKFRMTELGETYADAKRAAKQASCAGPAVWEAVDQTFRDAFNAAFAR